jgi:formate hydrogenlyase subunit 4
MAFAVAVGIVNLAVVLGLSPLFEGVVRKFIKARVHSRQGPPILQPYYDLFKLLCKEDLQVSDNWLLRFAPKLCLAAIMVSALLIPIGLLHAPLEGNGDLIALVYFVGLAAVAIVLGAAASESPYASIGLGREVMLLLTVEPVVVIGLLTAAVNAHSLRLSDIMAWQISHGPSISMSIAGFAILLALQAQAGKLPFDISEADQEIMGGPFIEQSGPKLALYKWSFWAKLVVFAAILCSIFIPWPRLDLLGPGSGALALAFQAVGNIIITLVKMAVVVIIVGLIDVVNPRLRIDQALAYFLGVMFMAVIGLTFALVGA